MCWFESTLWFDAQMSFCRRNGALKLGWEPARSVQSLGVWAVLDTPFYRTLPSPPVDRLPLHPPFSLPVSFLFFSFPILSRFQLINRIYYSASACVFECLNGCLWHGTTDPCWVGWEPVRSAHSLGVSASVGHPASPHCSRRRRRRRRRTFPFQVSTPAAFTTTSCSVYEAFPSGIYHFNRKLYIWIGSSEKEAILACPTIDSGLIKPVINLDWVAFLCWCEAQR